MPIRNRLSCPEHPLSGSGCIDCFERELSERIDRALHEQREGAVAPHCHDGMDPEDDLTVAFAVEMTAKDRRIGEVESQLDAAYSERNQLVAWLAAMFPSRLHRTDIDGWDPEWHWCVFIESPTGQMSWHFHDRELEMFSHVQRSIATWDGHSTEEKYRRVRRAIDTRAKVQP